MQHQNDSFQSPVPHFLVGEQENGGHAEGGGGQEQMDKSAN